MTTVSRRIHFPPILNGLDYLESTVALLGPKKGEPSARDLKYAVLHLQVAVETLLRARLALEGDRWVWAVPDAYDEARHKAGDFRSVGLEDAVQRVKDRCAPEAEIGPQRDYRALAKMRNRFQHLGVSESHAAVEALAVSVLDNLLTFVTADLLPRDHGVDSLAVERSVERVRTGLDPIRDLVALRLALVRDQLKGYEDSTLVCLSCAHFTVILDGGDTIACVLCGRSYGPPNAAAWDYTGTAPYVAAKSRDSDVVYDCAECDGAAICTTVASAPDRASWVCFQYGCQIDGLCEYCGRAARMTSEEPDMCRDCLEPRYAKF